MGVCCADCIFRSNRFQASSTIGGGVDDGIRICIRNTIHLTNESISEASMSLWNIPATPELLHSVLKNTIVEHLDIRITMVGDDYVQATMPVDHRTQQPYGLLHGGASVTLAETVGSAAAHLAAPEGCRVVGLEINANHLRGVREGLVTATARPLHIGRTTQVWEIRIVDQAERLVCVSRLTLAVQAANSSWEG
jgi:1,4-dihydroxy-2-naphthoyl-CoA hydrolase